MCEYAYQFMHVHGVGKKRFEILKKSFKTHGISARVHGNEGSKPPNALYSFAVMRSNIHSVCSTLPRLLTVLTSVTKQMFSDTDEVKICRTKFGIVIRLYSNHWVGISAGD